MSETPVIRVGKFPFGNTPDAGVARVLLASLAPRADGVDELLFVLDRALVFATAYAAVDATASWYSMLIQSAEVGRNRPRPNAFAPPRFGADGAGGHARETEAGSLIDGFTRGFIDAQGQLQALREGLDGDTLLSYSRAFHDAVALLSREGKVQTPSYP